MERKLLDKVGYKNFVSTIIPSQLSGGEQHRVALARAFSNNPFQYFLPMTNG